MRVICKRRDKVNSFKFSNLFELKTSYRNIKKEPDFGLNTYDNNFIVDEYFVKRNSFLNSLSSPYAKGYRRINCIRESESKDAILVSDGIQKEWIPKSKILGYKKEC